MKFSLTIIALFAAVAMASTLPASNPTFDAAGINCKKCGCSSKESCTFDCCQVKKPSDVAEWCVRVGVRC
ncbi:hypothetical protein BKA65DRAFT_594329 [Rhexocercosporidium sp. MPI-PUGE-AT-0058]|nr:hypothetical protein BKA65DRAFT_594329 [Rhexocercosporidium sp. MPI-PUGE-AT-0058]